MSRPTALDVTIQAQILELINRLRAELGLAVIIITHNLGVGARYVEQVHVMYAGKIVEQGTSREVFKQSRHPYTLGCSNPSRVWTHRQIPCCLSKVRRLTWGVCLQVAPSSPGADSQ